MFRVPRFAAVGINQQWPIGHAPHGTQQRFDQPWRRAVDAHGHDVFSAVCQGQTLGQRLAVTDVGLILAAEAEPGGNVGNFVNNEQKGLGFHFARDGFAGNQIGAASGQDRETLAVPVDQFRE